MLDTADFYAEAVDDSEGVVISIGGCLTALGDRGEAGSVTIAKGDGGDYLDANIKTDRRIMTAPATFTFTKPVITPEAYDDNLAILHRFNLARNTWIFNSHFTSHDSNPQQPFTNSVNNILCICVD